MTTKEKTGVSSKNSTTKTSKVKVPVKQAVKDYLLRLHGRVLKTPFTVWILFAMATALFAIDHVYGSLGAPTLGMLYMIADNAKKSGRADGNVYMRNGVIRGMRVPSNPQTGAQSAQRANFGFLSSYWNSLSDSQRATWNSASMPISDRFGRVVSLKGKQLFVALNRNLFNAGQDAITEAPMPIGIAPPTFLQTTITHSGDFDLAFTPDPIPAGQSWLVFTTGPKSAGTSKPGKSEFRLTKVLAAAATSPQDLIGAYESIWGIPVEGARIFTRVVVVDHATGLTSTPLGTDSIAST